MSVQGRRIVRMRVANSTIHRITGAGETFKVVEGFIKCEEYLKSTGDTEIDNQHSPNNIAASTWRVMVPHYLNLSTQSPSPDYKVGDLIYAAALDNPVVVKTNNTSWPENSDPSVNPVAGNAKRIPSLNSFSTHYGGANIDPKKVIFWVDLNVDGRTTGAGSGGGGGSTSVVWL